MNGFTGPFSKAYTQLISGALDSSGEFFPLESCVRTVTKNDAGQVTQIEASDGRNVWRQTTSYTGNVAKTSMWVSVTLPGQPAKPVLTAMTGAVSLAWSPGAAGASENMSSIWTDINGKVTPLTTNPQVIAAAVGALYTGTVSTLNAQGTGPASAQADAVTPLAVAPVPTSFSWIIKNTIFGSSAYAAQVGFHNPGRTSLLFHNDTPYWGQYILSGATNNDYNQPTGTWVDIPPNAQVLVTDPGKPYVRGKAFAITSITSDGTIATVTTAAPHNLATGSSVRIQDVTPSGYNGAFPNVTVTGANSFTYPLASTLAATTVPGTWAGRPLTGFTVQTKAAK